MAKLVRDQDNMEYIVVESTSWWETGRWPWPSRSFRVARAVCRSHSTSYRLYGGGWFPTTWALNVRAPLVDRELVARISGLGQPTPVEKRDVLSGGAGMTPSSDPSASASSTSARFAAQGTEPTPR